MFTKLTLGLGCFLLFISCSQHNQNSAISKQNNLEQKNLMEEKFDLDSIKPVRLSKQTQQITQDWMMYLALESEINRFQDYTLQDVVTNSGTINAVIDSLAETIPPLFATKAVNSRILSLRTHSELLQDHAQRIEPVPSEIKHLSAELKFDFRNLNIQLNEVFILDDNRPENTDSNN
jgi:hypothetical protein